MDLLKYFFGRKNFLIPRFYAKQYMQGFCGITMRYFFTLFVLKYADRI